MMTPRSQLTLEQDFESPIKQLGFDNKSEGEIATPPLPYSHSQTKHKLFSSARIVNKNPRSARNFPAKLETIIERNSIVTEKDQRVSCKYPIFSHIKNCDDENKEDASNQVSRKSKLKIKRKLTRAKKSMNSDNKAHHTHKDVTIPYETQKALDH